MRVVAECPRCGERIHPGILAVQDPDDGHWRHAHQCEPVGDTLHREELREALGWKAGPLEEEVEGHRVFACDGPEGGMSEIATEMNTELWWRATAQEDFEATVPKMHEYGGTEEGSADLQIMGNALAELCGMHDAPDAVKQEMACWFYALGKIARLVSDYKQGRPGKTDTWHDLTVYSMMARRLQDTGRWP